MSTHRKLSPLIFAGLLALALVIAGVGAWAFFLRAKKISGSPASPSSPIVIGASGSTGQEMSGLMASEAQNPNEDAVVPVACSSRLRLKENEFIFGKPGAFIRVTPSGDLVQTSGEELINLKTAFDPKAQDREIPLVLECAETSEGAPDVVSDVARELEAEGSNEGRIFFVSSLKPDQYFATVKGVTVTTELTPEDVAAFEKIHPTCVAETETSKDAPCVKAKLFALTDLNKNGLREYWFNEPQSWETGIGVIEEPDRRVLTACPGCAHE